MICLGLKKVVSVHFSLLTSLPYSILCFSLTENFSTGAFQRSVDYCLLEEHQWQLAMTFCVDIMTIFVQVENHSSVRY